MKGTAMSQQQQQRPPAPIVKQQAFDKLKAMLIKSQPLIEKRLPQVMTADRFIADVLTSIQRNPRLLLCNAVSVLGTVIQAAEIGLRLNGFLGEAYMVPFYNGKTSQLEAQLQAGYKGLINLARRSGEISYITPELVYDFDPVFELYYGTDRRIDHRPATDRKDRGRRDDNGDILGLMGAYSIVRFKDGNTDFEYCNLHRLEELRNYSQARDKEGNEVGPWTTEPGEMFRKVPIRQLCKRLPLQSDDGRKLVQAATLDEYGDAGVRQNNAALIESDSSFAGVLSDVVRGQVDDLANKYVNRQAAAAPAPVQPRQRATRQRTPYRPSNADRDYREEFPPQQRRA